jgi:hypothetical protein
MGSLGGFRPRRPQHGPGRGRGSSAGCARRCPGAAPSAAGGAAVAPLQRVDDGHVLGLRMLGRVRPDWYISAISERARQQVGQQLASTSLPSMRASTTWKSASSRVRPETSVRCDRGALVGAGGGAARATCASVMLRAQLPHHAASSRRAPRTPGAPPRRWAGDEGAARGLQRHQAVAAELVQRLAHEVRETLKMSAICCSASLVPGISRRSTMAE